MGARRVIALRPARPADRGLLEHWDRQAHVIDADPNDDWGWEIELARNPDWREQLIGTVDGRAVGFVQIIDPAREDSHYWGEIATGYRAIDIWIGEAADLGRGFGSAFMRLALARCFAVSEVHCVLIDPLASNARAHRFYQRLGFRPLRRQVFGADDCLVHALSRTDWQQRATTAG